MYDTCDRYLRMASPVDIAMFVNLSRPVLYCTVFGDTLDEFILIDAICTGNTWHVSPVRVRQAAAELPNMEWHCTGISCHCLAPRVSRFPLTHLSPSSP
jgi:hypothetical protein